jgi:hypothetical protein
VLVSFAADSQWVRFVSGVARKTADFRVFEREMRFSVGFDWVRFVEPPTAPDRSGPSYSVVKEPPSHTGLGAPRFRRATGRAAFSSPFAISAGNLLAAGHGSGLPS